MGKQRFWGFELLDLAVMWYRESDGTIRPSEQLHGWIKVLQMSRTKFGMSTKETNALTKKFYMGGQLFYEVSGLMWASRRTHVMYLKHPILLPVAWTVRILENLRMKLIGSGVFMMPWMWCWVTGFDSGSEIGPIQLKNFTFKGIKLRWRERAEVRKSFTWRTLFGFRIKPQGILTR